MLILRVIAKKRLEIELIEEERRSYFERYAMISKTSLVFETDAQGRIVFASEKFCQTSGYAQEELIGNTPRIIKSDKHTAQEYKEFWDTIKTGVIWNWELCNQAKNGSLFWVKYDDCADCRFTDTTNRRLFFCDDGYNRAQKRSRRKRKIANAVKSSATTGKYWATRQWYCA
jgi:PAS domain S-box-containing protein